jgi:hypothetical protein
MRSSLVATTGLRLRRTPSVRDLARRRQLALLAGVLGLALASGIIGLVTAPRAPAEAPARTGPFSYFPS